MPRNKPSLTARKVASDFLFVVEDPAIAELAPPGSIDATYELLETAGLLKPWMVSLIKAPWYQRFGRAIEKPILAGQMLHLVLRKRYLDDEVRAAIDAGATQVLVVGGGFDTLCLRLAAEYPEVTFLELDHPPTHRVKAKAVAAMGALRANLHLQGVDLSERRLADFLEESPVWSGDAFSAVVAEGVLMYLREEDVTAFLDGVRGSRHQASRHVCCGRCLERQEPGMAGRRLDRVSEMGWRAVSVGRVRGRHRVVSTVSRLSGSGRCRPFRFEETLSRAGRYG